MEFIDKSRNEIEGNSLVDSFLNSRWDSARNQYSDIHFDGKKFADNLKYDLRNLLLREQNYRCCYCMRTIAVQTTTLEHIVPQSAKTPEEFASYSAYSFISNNVCLQSVFENATTQQSTPPFPLQIAYFNLVASCNGQIIDGVPKDTTAKCCNNFRKNKVVEPLYYLENIAHEIEYTKAGMLVPLNVDHDSSIKNANLNYITLQEIREVWYHISKEEIEEIENANLDQRNDILTLNLPLLPSIKRNKLLANFKTDMFWSILMQYKWFYYYYRNKYHQATS